VPHGSVPTINIDTVTTLDVGYSNISNLTGIEDFASLTQLFCSGNSLTSLNLTQNTDLTHLSCNSNQLTSLDVTQNITLTELGCGINQSIN